MLRWIVLSLVRTNHGMTQNTNEKMNERHENTFSVDMPRRDA
jgi:hypothetical protein